MRIKLGKKGNFIAIIVVIIVIFINQKDKSSDSNKPKNVVKNSTKTVSSSAQVNVKFDTNRTYSSRPLDNSWPSIGNENEQIAKNLQESNYYIIFDGSGSMSKKDCSDNQGKLNVAKEAMDVFLNSMPTNSNVGLFIFDGRGANERVAITDFHKEYLMHHIKHSVAHGETPLREAISAGYNALSKQAKAQLGYGEYHLVIVTDGAASKGQDPLAIVQEILNESPIVIHTIGFCIGDNHSLNQAGLIDYKAANDPKSLLEGLEAVLAEAPDFNTNSFDGK